MFVTLHVHVGIGGSCEKKVQMDKLPEVGQEMTFPLGHDGADIGFKVFRLQGDTIYLSALNEAEICHQEFDRGNWSSHFHWPV